MGLTIACWLIVCWLLSITTVEGHSCNVVSRSLTSRIHPSRGEGGGYSSYLECFFCGSDSSSVLFCLIRARCTSVHPSVTLAYHLPFCPAAASVDSVSLIYMTLRIQKGSTWCELSTIQVRCPEHLPSFNLSICLSRSFASFTCLFVYLLHLSHSFVSFTAMTNSNC